MSFSLLVSFQHTCMDMVWHEFMIECIYGMEHLDIL